VCGDGLIQANVEQCDNGANNGNDKACKANCSLQICGDGFVGPGEACDDGNQNNADACTNVCKTASCGDGFVQPGEACDLGVNNSNTGLCTLACKAPMCGDGFTQPSNNETCDDANGSNVDACTNGCKLAACGDGFIQAGNMESCDDGNQVNTDSCTAQCKSAVCGDGFVQPDNGEACDDANQNPNDGCDNCGNSCKLVNGLKWCFNPAACGQPCNAVCAVYGSVPVNGATWFAAQDSPAECQNLATAFGINAISMGSYTYACLEDGGGSHLNTVLNSPLYCSTYNLCPTEHLNNMDAIGVACNSPQTSFRSICPCQ